MHDLNIAQLEQSDVLTDEAKLYVRKRAELWIRAEVDEKQQAAVIKMCRDGRDRYPGWLFFAQYFAWIFEPRNLFGFKKLPFVPYEYQVEELGIIHEAVLAGVGVVGLRTLTLWLKSRDMGLTWLVLFYFVWYALFHSGHFHVGSRNESEVDTKKDVKSLFFKIRYLLNNLPLWMLNELAPDRDDKHMLYAWHRGEVGITGETANEDFATGNRQTAILADEYSKWEKDRTAFRSMTFATNCVFLVGTPKGYGNHYSEIARNKTGMDVNIRRVHWLRHPLKAKDAEMIGGKWTSPWYRRECANIEADMIAGELDLSFEGSTKGLIYAALYTPAHQKKGLKPIPGLPIYRSWDPGGWAGCLWFQKDRWGRIRVYKELIQEGWTLKQFAEEVLRISGDLERKGYILDPSGRAIGKPSDWFTWQDCGDPSGTSMGKMNQEVPEYDALYNDHGIDVQYTFISHMPTEMRVRARHVAVEDVLKKPIMDPQEPGFGLWIDEDECPILNEAMLGGYRRMLDPRDGNVDGEGRVAKRHPYNEAADCLGYGVLYVNGIPERIKKEWKPKSREEEDDERDLDYNAPRRTRC